VKQQRGPTLLVVLDGWGHREERENNAIRQNAHCFEELSARYPFTLLSASGHEVGLPMGLMGNSEVGHTNMGAGRVVFQDITRIDKEIGSGSFFSNGTLVAAMDSARRSGAQLHLLGLVSDGGVHSSQGHLSALLELAAQSGLSADKVLVHAILDGRDTPPRSGVDHLAVLERDIQRVGVGRVASIVGRYWAMDRDKRWERVQRAFELFTRGTGRVAQSSVEGLRASYEAGVEDEFVEPCVVGEPGSGRISGADVVLCFNFRADRMRQLCLALAGVEFDGFDRGEHARPELVSMAQYRADFPFPVAYPRKELKGVFPELVSAAGLRQKRIAETEKYAHVTFFFSGGEEREYPGESRILIPSPRVATYDMQPQMSAFGVRDAVLESLREDETEVYVVNFANADMVGHTGQLEAAGQAVAAVDECLRAIVPAVTEKGGVCAITADHGNAELMWDAGNDQPHTAHTSGPVPFVLCSDDLLGAQLRSGGALADVAPTLLQLMGLERSEGMDGESLLQAPGAS